MAANKSAKISSSSVSLPPELILEIFSRLPSESIQRLRPILDDESRTYLNTYEFQHKHAFKVLNQPTNKRVLITSSNDGLIHEIDPYPCMLSSSSPPITRSHDLYQIFKDIFKMTADIYHYRIIGASNGLICLYFNFKVRKAGPRRWPHFHRRSYITSHHLILWNPCTKELHALPKPQGINPELSGLPFNYNYYKPTHLGFGYDTANKTYKLVMAEGSVTRFYDLSTDLWKVVETIRIAWNYSNYEVYHDRNSTIRLGQYLNGSLHWIVSKLDIVSIDLSKEVSSLINLPRCCSNEHQLNLGVYKGCLLISCFWTEGKELNIWVMKEYGRVGSWTNIATIKDLSNMNWGPGIMIYRPPLLVTQHEKMLFAFNGEFAWLFPMDEKFCHVNGLKFDEHCPGIVHVDTLVSPKPEVYGFCKDDSDNNNKALVSE